MTAEVRWIPVRVQAGRTMGGSEAAQIFAPSLQPLHSLRLPPLRPPVLEPHLQARNYFVTHSAHYLFKAPPFSAKLRSRKDDENLLARLLPNSGTRYEDTRRFVIFESQSS